MSDRQPKSKRNYDQADSLGNNADQEKLYLERFQKWTPGVQRIRRIDEPMFIDRFRPSSSEKFAVYFGEDSLHFMRWGFKDSIKTKSAFYNWMDDNDVSYFGAPEAIEKQAFSMIYSDTLLLIVSGAVDFKEWRKVFEEEELLPERSYLIEQRRYGKARWYERIEEKYKEITEE